MKIMTNGMKKPNSPNLEKSHQPYFLVKHTMRSNATPRKFRLYCDVLFVKARKITDRGFFPKLTQLGFFILYLVFSLQPYPGKPQEMNSRSEFISFLKESGETLEPHFWVVFPSAPVWGGLNQRAAPSGVGSCIRALASRHFSSLAFSESTVQE